MKTLLKTAIVAGLLAGVSMQPAQAQQRPRAAAAPAAAPASTLPIVPGLGVASVEVVVANSAAMRAAEQQRPISYKAQIDAYNTRGAQLEAELKPLIERLQADAKAKKPNQEALEAQAKAIEDKRTKGQEELNTLIQPVAYSQAYVAEQIDEKVGQAVKNAMTKRRISILLNPQAIEALNSNAYNLNGDILAELNTLIPSAQLVPPQGWEPRQVREARQQQQQQQAQPGAAPAAPGAAAPAPAPVPAPAAPAQPAGPQVDGR